MSATRTPLPHRRPSVTQTLRAGNQSFVATVGFDPSTGKPRELFLSAGKEGSMLNSLLADAATVVSIALQYDIPPEALLKSLGRQPVGPVAPADLDKTPERYTPASPIGAALDLLCRLGQAD
jgi:ribonucleoside-diphosphate reductase alpha chain